MYLFNCIRLNKLSTISKSNDSPIFGNLYLQYLIYLSYSAYNSIVLDPNEYSEQGQRAINK